jgi:SOS-response transcriptional repressor LexA
MAADPLPPEPVQTGTVSVPADLIPPDHGRLGAWQVAGDCMSGDGILDGDVVIVDFDRVPADGDIVAACIRNWRHTETGELACGRMLKRLRMAGGTTVLEPSNPAYLPMRIKPEHQLVIESVVIGVLRSCETGETGE